MIICDLGKMTESSAPVWNLMLWQEMMMSSFEYRSDLQVKLKHAPCLQVAPVGFHREEEIRTYGKDWLWTCIKTTPAVFIHFLLIFSLDEGGHTSFALMRKK